jgi:hypothetical protein
MSGFADFLLATRKDAKAIVRTDNPTSRWPGFDTSDVNEIDLQNLYEIVTGEKDAELEFDVLHCDESGDGPSVSCLPKQLIDLLASLNAKRVSQAAKKWVKSEEFRDLWKIDALEEMLEKLCDLARRAKAEKKLVLLCSSGS